MNATYLSLMGRFDQGIQEMRQAKELDPITHTKNLAWAYFAARRYDESIREFAKSLEINPNDVSTHVFLAYTYALKRMDKEAISHCEKAKALQPGAYALGMCGYCYALSGRKKEAYKILDELIQLSSRSYVDRQRIGAPAPRHTACGSYSLLMGMNLPY